MTTPENFVDTEILRPLNNNEVQELLKLYEEKCGRQSFQYLLIYTQCKWNRKLQEMNVKYEDDTWISMRKVFYTHRNGDFRKYGTYVCLHQDLMQSVTFHTWEPNLNEMLECLNKTNLIQWFSGPLFINVAPEYSEQVKQIALLKGISIQRARKCHGFILPHDTALSFKKEILPQGYRMDCLREHEADHIHSLWVNKKEGSAQYLKGLIKFNESLGVYEEQTDKLVGWILTNEFSGLAILEVLPVAQRRGLGAILAREQSKQIAKTECVNLSAWTLIENMKSIPLLEKIGYEKTVVYEWIQFNKVDKS